MTLYIDPSTNDLSFDGNGNLRKVYDNETTAQNVRLTLLAYLGDFPLETTHGTEYPRFLGRKHSDLPQDEAQEIFRDAILQETDLAYVQDLSVTHSGRSAEVAFTGILRSGDTITAEVTALG